MLRLILVAAALALPAAPAYADPEGLCGLEEQGQDVPPCPPYVTYDEEGKEVGGK